MSRTPEYWIMDERAMYDVDKAIVYVVADTLEEARDDASDFAPCVIVKDNQVVEYVS